jgi:hypothetical protein
MCKLGDEVVEETHGWFEYVQEMERVVEEKIEMLVELRGTMRYLSGSDVGLCVPHQTHLPFFQIASHYCLGIGNSGRLERVRG